MPVICHPTELARQEGPGWAIVDWAGEGAFGRPVPMRARRVRVDPGGTGPGIAITGAEALVYVIAGSGTTRAGPAEGQAPGTAGEAFCLTPESVLWLTAGGLITAEAGPDGLDLLVAESAGPEGTADSASAGAVPARTLLAAAELPHLASTRDTRDRLDLVTENVPVAARLIRADRIIYHPGDTAAAHYHTDCHHVFCVLTGSGLLYGGGRALRLAEGMSVLVGPGEEHWFENDRTREFSFVEFWAPPPADTVWTVVGDRCTWAPAG